MTDTPNLLFIWTDQQSANTLPQYGNDVVDVPNLNELADQSTVFQNPYVTQSICGPSRSTVMTGKYPHSTGIFNNQIPLAPDDLTLPQLGSFDEYATCWIGKWHLGDEVFRQRGFDEWISIDDCYWPFYGDDRPEGVHSTYHNFLVEHGYEPDQEQDGFEWFSRRYVADTVPEEHSKPAYMANEAIEFIETHRDQPFILYLMFLEPHFPYTGPRDDQYDVADVPLPPNFDQEHLDDQIDRVRFSRNCYTDPDLDPAGVEYALDFAGYPPTEDGWKHLISNYWGLVSLVDTHVGRVLDVIEDVGLFDETITVYTSDHGDMMGAHQLASKMLQFEEVVKVPLFVRIPGTDAIGETIDAPVSHIDLVPTLLDAMGQTVPEGLQGHSWLPFLEGRGDLVEENVFIEWNGSSNIGIWDISAYNEAVTVPTPSKDAETLWAKMGVERDLIEVVTDPVRTIVTPEGWKLNYRRSGDHELYDLDADPYEIHNVVDDHPDVVDELHETIVDWQFRTRDPVSL